MIFKPLSRSFSSAFNSSNPDTSGTTVLDTEVILGRITTSAVTRTTIPVKIEPRIRSNLFSFFISSASTAFDLTTSSPSSSALTFFTLSFNFLAVLSPSSNSLNSYSIIGSFARLSSIAVFISLSISLASAYLFFGFLAVDLFRILTIEFGTLDNFLVISGRGSFNYFKAISTAFSPLNGNSPVRSSYISIPME